MMLEREDHPPWREGKDCHEHTPVALSYLNKGSGTYGTTVTDTYTLSTCVKVNNPLMSVYMCLLRVKLVPLLREPSLF